MQTPTPMPELTAVPAQVRAFGEQLLTASAIADDVGGFAAGAARSSGFEGATDEAYQQARGRIGTAADSGSLALRAIAGRILDHASMLDRLSAQHTDLIARHDGLMHLAAQARDAGDALHGAGGSARGVILAAVADYEADRAAWITRLAEAETTIMAAFHGLATLPAVERAYGGVADPADAVVRSVPGPAATPAAVREWWRRLTPAERQGLVAADPEVVGDRDGVPAWARDRADVVRLDRDLEELAQVPAERRSAEQRVRLAHAESAAEALTRMRAARDPLTGGRYATQLYLYEPDAFDGDGAVAAAVGDLDRARDLAVTVPGFGTNADSALTQSAKAIDVQQASDQLGDGASHATMFWIGYDAPDGAPWRGGDAAGVVTDDMARAGGRHLARAVEGLTQMRQHDPHLTVVGYSYGSTTAALGAAQATPGAVDDLVLVGSPGAGRGIDHAAQTGVGAGHVWVGRNSADPITRLGGHGWLKVPGRLDLALGTDPAAADFGARRFEAESTTRGEGPAIADHLKYFDHDTESLASIAHVVDGDYAAVVAAPPVIDPLLPHPGRQLWSMATQARGVLADLGDVVDDPTHVADDGLDGAMRSLAILDQLVGGPVDPEATRPPTTPDTDGR